MISLLLVAVLLIAGCDTDDDTELTRLPRGSICITPDKKIAYPPEMTEQEAGNVLLMRLGIDGEYRIDDPPPREEEP
jgi:hypothetical protein